MAFATRHGFFYLQDLTSPTGSRLFGGSLIRIWAQRASISSQNNTDVAFRPNQEFEIGQTTSTDSGNVGSMWNRRKAHAQISGMEQLQISMAGGWHTDQVGSANDFGPGSPVNLSPYKLIRMALSGHQFYFRGGTAVQSIIDGEAHDITNGSQVGSLYTGSGIPVIIATWDMEDVAEKQDYVTWNLSLIEDRDSTFLTN